MARSSWDGFLRLSLISIPVRAYNSAAPQHGEIHFNQLHKGCGERIQYKKFCPVHGEVSKDEIVSGYQVKKNEYVEVDRDELTKVRAENDDSIDIQAFVPPDTVDAAYYSGKTFYLVPNGPAGQKPYALLNQVMTEKNVHAIGQVVLSGHEEAVLIRTVGKVLAMTVLFYGSQVKSPDTVEPELTEPKVSAQERKLAAALVDESLVEQFDLSALKDHYTERVTELLEAKAGGKRLHAPKKAKAAGVINLMDALKKSLEESRGKKRSAPPHRKKTA